MRSFEKCLLAFGMWLLTAWMVINRGMEAFRPSSLPLAFLLPPPLTRLVIGLVWKGFFLPSSLKSWIAFGAEDNCIVNFSCLWKDHVAVSPACFWDMIFYLLYMAVIFGFIGISSVEPSIECCYLPSFLSSFSLQFTSFFWNNGSINKDIMKCSVFLSVAHNRRN